MKFKQVDIN